MSQRSGLSIHRKFDAVYWTDNMTRITGDSTPTQEFDVDLTNEHIGPVDPYDMLVWLFDSVGVEPLQTYEISGHAQSLLGR